MSAWNRRITSSRFCAWLRVVWHVSRSTPSLLTYPRSLPTTRCFCPAVRRVDAVTSKVSSTCVAVLFTCCPPGPPLRVNRRRSSPSGIATALLTLSTLSSAMDALSNTGIARF